MWENLEPMNGGKPMPEMPETLPWLAIAFAAEVALFTPEMLMAAADLERCVAWTILAQEGLID